MIDRDKLTEAQAWLASLSVAGDPTEAAWKAAHLLLNFPTNEMTEAMGTATLASGYPAYKKVSIEDRLAMLNAVRDLIFDVDGLTP